jgi:hypothetical protein
MSDNVVVEVTPKGGPTKSDTAEAEKLLHSIRAETERNNSENENRNKKLDINLKSEWSSKVGHWIAILIVAQIFFILAFSSNLFDFARFKNSQFHNILLAFYVQSFLQVVGLVWLIVRYLFPQAEKHGAGEVRKKQIAMT